MAGRPPLVGGLTVVATAPEALAYAGSYLIVGYMVRNALFSSVRWPFLSEIYETAQTTYLIRAVAGAVLRPHSTRCNVTSKDETLDETYLSDVYRPLTAVASSTAERPPTGAASGK